MTHAVLRDPFDFVFFSPACALQFRAYVSVLSLCPTSLFGAASVGCEGELLLLLPPPMAQFAAQLYASVPMYDFFPPSRSDSCSIIFLSFSENAIVF